MFAAGSQNIVHGSLTSNTIVHHHNDGGVQVVNAMKQLQDHAAIGALYNSKERHNPPKCHPNTREEVLQDIIDRTNGRPKMLWLCGSAGVGKSAIMQSTAEQLDSAQRLAAAFFFSRSAAGSHRDHEERFINTIVLQLVESIPGLAPYIVDAIIQTPSIWGRSLTNQAKVLILEPLRLFTQHTPQITTYPCVIVVDGLDECRQEGQVQVLEALRMLSDEASFKVVVASRPEYTIKDWISELNSNTGDDGDSILNLDLVWGDDDVRLVFQKETGQIKKSHVIRRLIPADWPSMTIVDKAVQKASGHFIYVSTLLKYIKSPRHPPHIRLERALDESNPSIATHDRPFTDLDNLYLFVLSNAEERDAIHELLALGIVQSDAVRQIHVYFPLTESTICKLCPVISLDVTFLDVASIIQYPVSKKSDIPYEPYHASLYDFLRDPIRSKEFFVDLPHWRVHFCVKALELLHVNLSKQENGKDIDTLYQMAMLLSIKHLADPNVTSKLDALCNISDTSIDFFVKHCPYWFYNSTFKRDLEVYIPHSYIEETPPFRFYSRSQGCCEFFHPSAYRLLQRRIMPLLHSHLQAYHRSRILPPQLIPLIAVNGDIIDTFKFNNVDDANAFNPFLHNSGWSSLLDYCHEYRVPGSPIFTPKDFPAAVLFLLNHFQCRIVETYPDDDGECYIYLLNIFEPLVRSTLSPEVASLLPDAITSIEEKFDTIPFYRADHDARSMLKTLVAYVEIYRKLSYLYEALGETDNSQTLPGNLTQQDLREMRFGELAERAGLGGSYGPEILVEGGFRGFEWRKSIAKHQSKCSICGVQNSVEPSI